MADDIKNLPQLASRVFNRPLLLEPGYAAVFMSALASKFGLASLTDVDGIEYGPEQMATLSSSFTRRTPDGEMLYNITNGVAVLTVRGTLVQRSGFLTPFSGMTGYNGLIERMKSAQSDPSVRGVLLDMDTPGGEVSGCFDTVRTLRKLAKEGGKPVWSLSNDLCCSAGYAIASAASYRLVTSSSQTGSIGVVMAHTSVEQMYDLAGIDVTLIHSGAHKVDGNPYESLPPQVREKWQAESDALRLEFATLVAETLPLSAEEVMSTEAAVYTGQAAIDAGLADRMVNGYEAVAEFVTWLDSRSGRKNPQGAKAMDMNEDQKELSTARAEGAAAVKARMKAIAALDGAGEFPELTACLQYDTDLEAEACSAIFAAAGMDMQAALQLNTSTEEPNQSDMNTPLDQAMKVQGTTAIKPAAGAENSEPGRGELMSALLKKMNGIT
ncbi:S49 family peptidase [Pokkaliibacter sp. CJK22405]|uniref:S49 family peptidase n=1 Tax=Pokkaliibacter sp. CJK22405 TaxID=3384615 RepID=UPI0039856253